MTPASRFDRIDLLRGAALLWMAAFHFSFDLDHAGFIRQDFYADPWWTGQRTCIVSLFLFCAGLSQAVAIDRGQSTTRFWRRWAQIAGCAALVSVGSWFMFPHSWISFGVLHGIAVMLIVTRYGARLATTPALWAVGALAIALPWLVASPFFDSRWTDWIGLVTHKPITEDYVPLLPWLGVMLWGLAAGRWLLRRRPSVLQGPIPGVMQPLARLGRWSLSFYMLHQPVLIGVVTLAATIRG
jgi:uncharacterized membrane protein